MSAIKDIWNMGAAKLQQMSVEGKLHDHLMSNFPEGVVGLKNMATISNTIKAHIKSGYPEKAVQYAKDQSSKIDQQKRAAQKRVPRY